MQLPYGIPANRTGIVGGTNGGQSAAASLGMGEDAPGVFTFDGGAPVPFSTAARGQVITLFITGAGAVSPAVSTGAPPASGTAIADLPKPLGAVTVTVGGVAAPVEVD